MKLYDMTEKELLIKVASDLENLKETVDEIKENCKEQKSKCECNMADKVSWRTFAYVLSAYGALLITLFTIGVSTTKDINAEINRIVKEKANICGGSAQ